MPTAGHGAITHFTVGTAVSGAGKILFIGTVTPNITISIGVTPVLTTASTVTLGGSQGGDTWENDLAKLVFQATNIANIADNAASSPLTNLYLALHTADPTGSGSQTSSEASYNGYARQAVARTSGGFSVSGGVASLVSNCSFAAVLAD